MNFDDALTILSEEKDFDNYNKKYFFTIQGSEGYKAHIHYFKTSKKNPEREGCISLEYAGYFNHSSQHQPLDNAKVEKWIFDLLSNDSEWIKACNLWNSMNVIKVSTKINPYKRP